jgi:hypothetical protein
MLGVVPMRFALNGNNDPLYRYNGRLFVVFPVERTQTFTAK